MPPAGAAQSQDGIVSKIRTRPETQKRPAHITGGALVFCPEPFWWPSGYHISVETIIEISKTMAFGGWFRFSSFCRNVVMFLRGECPIPSFFLQGV